MNLRDVDLNSKEWCDLVFEHRNKEYGAYYLRKTAARRRLFALSVVLAAVVIVILLVEIIHFRQTVQAQDYYEVKPIELSNLIGLEESENNQVKAEEKSPEKETGKLAPPTITKDEDIVEDQKELEETALSPDSIDTSTLEEDSILSQNNTEELNREDEEDATVINEKNRNAQFQDGKTDLLRYIYQNIHYPPAALKQRINGRVICSFIVNEDGSLSDITLVQGVYVFLDDEVLRVVRSMPVWKPALKDGKPVKIKYVMPVVFKLN